MGPVYLFDLVGVDCVVEKEKRKQFYHTATREMLYKSWEKRFCLNTHIQKYNNFVRHDKKNSNSSIKEIIASKVSTEYKSQLAAIVVWSVTK